MPLATTHTNNPKPERLEARINAAQKRLFKRAAALQGNTLTDFIVSTLQIVATKIIQDHDLMKLTGQDRETFISALLKPTLPSGRLKKAVARYKRVMG